MGREEGGREGSFHHTLLESADLQLKKNPNGLWKHPTQTPHCTDGETEVQRK